MSTPSFYAGARWGSMTRGGWRRRSEAGGRRRRPRYHHGNLPQALRDAALALINEAGADALTLRGAAKRAGVSQAAPYRHFRNKEALLAAVAEEGFRAMAEAMGRRAAPHRADPAGRLRALGRAYVEFATRHPAHFRVMFGRVPSIAPRIPVSRWPQRRHTGFSSGPFGTAKQRGCPEPEMRRNWRSARGPPSMACPR
jgi:AcrR family transcriptional regulator